jgi:[ribulose-bisphosphate carboxylase]/[fructose-bisphosphate aldolase]-lysine N-methyltransferase
MFPAFGFSGVTPLRCRLCALRFSARDSRTGPVVWRMSNQASPFAELVTWMKSSGANISPALRFSDERTTVKMDKAVSKGTQIASIPGSIILSVETARRSLEGELSDLSPQSQLAAILLAERVKGGDSGFDHLIKSLCSRGVLDHPYMWSPHQLAWLSGSAVRDKALQMRQGFEDEWKLVCEFLDSSLSLEDYLWAQAVVDRFAVELGSSFPLALAPLVDLLELVNRVDDQNIAIVASASNFFSKPQMLLLPNRDITPGDTLKACFAGPNATVADFVLDYGVVPVTNGVVSAPSTAELAFTLTDLDRFYDDKADILEINSHVENPNFVLADSLVRGAWSPPEGMEQFLRLLCLRGQDAFLLEGVFRRDVWGFMALPVSHQNEKAMCEVVIAACEDALDGYHETVPENVDAGDKSRANIAELVVKGEKRVLAACIDHYVRDLQCLDAREYYQERRLNELDLLRPLDESEIVDSEVGPRMSRSFDENY